MSAVEVHELPRRLLLQGAHEGSCSFDVTCGTSHTAAVHDRPAELACVAELAPTGPAAATGNSLAGND